jgi:hypothetical protein
MTKVGLGLRGRAAASRESRAAQTVSFSLRCGSAALVYGAFYGTVLAVVLPPARSDEAGLRCSLRKPGPPPTDGS